MSGQTVSFQIAPPWWGRLHGVEGLLPTLVCSCSRFYCIVILPGIAGVIVLAFGVFCGCLNGPLSCCYRHHLLVLMASLEDFDYSGKIHTTHEQRVHLILLSILLCICIADFWCMAGWDDAAPY